MATIGALENEAAKRKERLKALRKKKQGEEEVFYINVLIIFFFSAEIIAESTICQSESLRNLVHAS